MNTRRNIIAQQPSIMVLANTRRRLIMPTPRTVTICTRCITQPKRQSVTSSCTGISRPHIVQRKALRAIVRRAFLLMATRGAPRKPGNTAASRKKWGRVLEIRPRSPRSQKHWPTLPNLKFFIPAAIRHCRSLHIARLHVKANLAVNAQPKVAEARRQFSQTAHRREAWPRRDRT
jgi:hypothetical protein